MSGSGRRGKQKTARNSQDPGVPRRGPRPAAAKNFEAAVKRHTIKIPENGANVQNGIPLDHDRIHERFSLEDIVQVMDAIDEVRQRPHWKKETEPPKKTGRT